MLIKEYYKIKISNPLKLKYVFGDIDLKEGEVFIKEGKFFCKNKDKTCQVFLYTDLVKLYETNLKNEYRYYSKKDGNVIRFIESKKKKEEFLGSFLEGTGI